MLPESKKMYASLDFINILVASVILTTACSAGHAAADDVVAAAEGLINYPHFDSLGYVSSHFAGWNDSAEGTTIPVLGLYELTKKVNETYDVNLEGLAELYAAQLAIQHVNNAQLLGNLRMKLFVNDTKCDPGVAIDVFFHAIFSRRIKAPILLGSACSDATASLANVAPYWQTVQISHGATSPVLRDRKAFPTFFRVVASDASHNAARVAFIQHFQWRVVTVLSQDTKEYTLTANNLVKMLEGEKISCRGTITFDENDFDDQLQSLKDTDTRIIIGSFSTKVASRILCKVHELGMFGEGYVWILSKERHGSWWSSSDSSCPLDIMKAVLEGAIIVDGYHGNKKSDSGFSSDDLRASLFSRELPSDGRYTRESYDAVWAAALALSAVQVGECIGSECTKQKDLTPSADTTDEVFAALQNLEFVGVSGPIMFQGADRIGTSALQQIQGGVLRTVAIFSPSESGLNTSCYDCWPMSWTTVPIAQRYIKLQVYTISTTVFFVVSTATAIAIFVACLFLVFNLYFRKLKLIKLSSPRLNNISVVGCIAVYIGVFLLGLDNATNPFPSRFPALCAAKIYLFAGGFSLAFGSIFAKTYRIHKIFISSRGGFVKKKYLQDTQLILLVCVLLVVDGIVITTWVVFDPLDRQLRNLTQQVSETDRSVIYLPQIEICSCSYLHGWLSLIYGYKGLQLAIGVYMAWETRHVKIPALNDSQYIGISVYGVVITSCIVVVLANVVAEQPTVAYLTISAMILTTTTATLGLLFFPKVITVVRRRDVLDPVMQSVGLKLESNTRRFPTDDAKEKLFRLEVQNRVFKRELHLLRAEIRRLGKLLDSPASPTDVSSISLEIASFKCTGDDNASSPSSSSERPEKSKAASLPRRSWPSDRVGAMTREPRFRSHQHLQEDSARSKVFVRIRNLIRSKRIELKRMAEQQNVEEPRRKFSLTMCLQAERLNDHKEIIIDLDPSESDTVQLKRYKYDNQLKLRRPSVPLIVINFESKKFGQPTSLPELETSVRRDEEQGIKCRSLDDNQRGQKTWKRY